MQGEAPDERTQSAYEIESLLAYRAELETEQFMRTAEGRLVQLRESFMEEYSTDVNPAEPFKTALGRARERAEELQQQQTKEKEDTPSFR